MMKERRNFPGYSMANHRFVYVDCLRAIAAITVFVHHFFGDVLHQAPNSEGVLPQWLMFSVLHLDLGRFGVVLFFLISGFVAPFSLRGVHPLKSFATSRFFRLYPVLWLAILTLTLAQWLVGEPVSWARVGANLTMEPLFFGQAWLLGSYWTLSIEILFYVVAAGLFACGALYRPAVIAGTSVCLIASTALPIAGRALLGISSPVLYWGIHLSFLMTGLLLRLAILEKIERAMRWTILVIILQFAVLFTIGDFSLNRGDSFFIIGKTPIIAAYILAFVTFFIAVTTRKPETKILLAIGQTSYSIYLFHTIIAYGIYRYAPLTGDWSDLVVGLGLLALTLLISFATYRWVEKPMMRVGRIFIDRLNKKNQPTSRP